MKEPQLVRTRLVLSDNAFASMVAKRMTGSTSNSMVEEQLVRELAQKLLDMRLVEFKHQHDHITDRHFLDAALYVVSPNNVTKGRSFL
jgi:hypothetical protein